MQGVLGDLKEILDGVRVKAAELAIIILYIGAVSYTHLRAHETVLDLVCRLLLEKKKNTIPDSFSL